MCQRTSQPRTRRPCRHVHHDLHGQHGPTAATGASTTRRECLKELKELIEAALRACLLKAQHAAVQVEQLETESIRNGGSSFLEAAHAALQHDLLRVIMCKRLRACGAARRSTMYVRSSASAARCWTSVMSVPRSDCTAAMGLCAADMGDTVLRVRATVMPRLGLAFGAPCSGSVPPAAI